MRNALIDSGDFVDHKTSGTTRVGQRLAWPCLYIVVILGILLMLIRAS